jgi:hypothetical protein
MKNKCFMCYKRHVDFCDSSISLLHCNVSQTNWFMQPSKAWNTCKDPKKELKNIAVKQSKLKLFSYKKLSHVMCKHTWFFWFTTFLSLYYFPTASSRNMLVGNVTHFNSTYSRVGNKLHESMTKLFEKVRGGIATSKHLHRIWGFHGTVWETMPFHNLKYPKSNTSCQWPTTIIFTHNFHTVHGHSFSNHNVSDIAPTCTSFCV